MFLNLVLWVCKISPQLTKQKPLTKFRGFFSLLFWSLKRSYHFQNQKSLSDLLACNQELKWSFASYQGGNRSPFQYDLSFERSRLPFEPTQLCSSFLLPGSAGRSCFWPQYVPSLKMVLAHLALQIKYFLWNCMNFILNA